MRIIAGKSKGRLLVAVKGRNTRPTSDRVKESIFNIIQYRIEDSIVLDLFSGTGNLGLEALSRGAKKAIFIDSNRKAVEAIKTNCTNLGYLEDSEIYRKDALAALTGLAKRDILFDIIFMDPPYDKGHGEILLEAIIRADILHNDGIIITEHDASLAPPKSCHDLYPFDSRKYGGTGISFYRKG